MLIAASEQLGGTKRMQLIVCRDLIDITNLKGFISGFTITDPENGIAKIAFIFTMIILDGSRYARDASGGFIFWRLMGLLGGVFSHSISDCCQGGNDRLATDWG